MHKCDLNKVALQFYLNRPEIFIRAAEHPPPGEHLWGTASVKYLNYKKLLFPFVKRNLLTLKINKEINKRK